MTVSYHHIDSSDTEVCIESRFNWELCKLEISITHVGLIYGELFLHKTKKYVYTQNTHLINNTRPSILVCCKKRQPKHTTPSIYPLLRGIRFQICCWMRILVLRTFLSKGLSDSTICFEKRILPTCIPNGVQRWQTSNHKSWYQTY